jgi:hypothetical protein
MHPFSMTIERSLAFPGLDFPDLDLAVGGPRNNLLTAWGKLDGADLTLMAAQFTQAA